MQEKYNCINYLAKISRLQLACVLLNMAIERKDHRIYSMTDGTPSMEW